MEGQAQAHQQRFSGAHGGLTAEQLTWFLKGFIAGKGVEAAHPPTLQDWQALVQEIMTADTPLRRSGGCGCGGKSHG